MADALNDLVRTATQYVPFVDKIQKYLPACQNTQQPTYIQVAPVSEMSGLVRLAGLSGALAISFGAYGSHVVRDNPNIPERRRLAFETGSRYHLIHSLALLGAKNARYPLLTAGLFTSGILLFCGPCYHYSLTGAEETRKFTPIGGVTLILAWLSFII